MTSYVDLTGLDQLIERVEAISELDATPLMLTWQRIIEEDNRRGILAGTDKDGNRLTDVRYRPKGKPAKLTAAQKNTNNSRARKGTFAGFGPIAAGLHNNLTHGEYEKLSGPPLAPRGAFSRVITNLMTSYRQTAARAWEAVGAWIDVVSTRGVPFLHAHFEGLNGLPKRDLRGVRPEGREKARKAMIAWMSDQIRYAATGQMNRTAA